METAFAKDSNTLLARSVGPSLVSVSTSQQLFTQLITLDSQKHSLLFALEMQTLQAAPFLPGCWPFLASTTCFFTPCSQPRLLPVPETCQACSSLSRAFAQTVPCVWLSHGGSLLKSQITTSGSPWLHLKSFPDLDSLLLFYFCQHVFLS